MISFSFQSQCYSSDHLTAEVPYGREIFESICYPNQCNKQLYQMEKLVWENSDCIQLGLIPHCISQKSLNIDKKMYVRKRSGKRLCLSHRNLHEKPIGLQLKQTTNQPYEHKGVRKDPKKPCHNILQFKARVINDKNNGGIVRKKIIDTSTSREKHKTVSSSFQQQLFISPTDCSQNEGPLKDKLSKCNSSNAISTKQSKSFNQCFEEIDQPKLDHLRPIHATFRSLSIENQENHATKGLQKVISINSLENIREVFTVISASEREDSERMIVEESFVDWTFEGGFNR